MKGNVLRITFLNISGNRRIEVYCCQFQRDGDILPPYPFAVRTVSDGILIVICFAYLFRVPYSQQIAYRYFCHEGILVDDSHRLRIQQYSGVFHTGRKHFPAICIFRFCHLIVYGRIFVVLSVLSVHTRTIIFSTVTYVLEMSVHDPCTISFPLICRPHR